MEQDNNSIVISPAELRRRSVPRDTMHHHWRAQWRAADWHSCARGEPVVPHRRRAQRLRAS
ncbi:hypothetical protein PsYK624_015030 [Phanerochaete sordida]|uniref:Uncharacterized protein n=1 Tax=Phanerochaete sordida TaxID=48140 RepID=A0A9P3G003_9APHY|nr:hypothetical protein PsYK624_015030 [Phanerochaete sordida]